MEFLGLLLFVAVLAALILPWVNMTRLNRQRNELKHLKYGLHQLQDRRVWMDKDKRKSVEPEAPPSVGEVPIAKESRAPQAIPEPSIAKVRAQPEPQITPLPARQTVLRHTESAEPPQHEKKPPHDWFSKLAVWIGGVALLMAGFYMVKYSIESGWLTPKVRVVLTTGFGLFLSFAGLWIGLKATQVANRRIGQALSGAGVACLYFAAYAAVHLYGLMDTTAGFICMVVVTVFAVLLSLKNGAAIALMGLVGGFLTPLLMQTDNADTVLLFSYLFILFCGAQYLCIRRGWWGLLLGSLVAVYLWSLFVIGYHINQLIPAMDGAMFFVIGVCAVNALWMMKMKPVKLSKNECLIIASIRILVWVGGLAQSLALVSISGFTAIDMSMFAVLSIGALSLSVIKEEEFQWASWAAFGAVVVATLAYPGIEGWSWCAWPGALLTLFFIVGHWRGLGSKQVKLWRGLSISSLLSLVPLLYVNRLWVAEIELQSSGFYLVVSLLYAFGLLLAAEHLKRREVSLNTVGEYTALASFLALFGLWTYLPGQYFSYSVAGLWILGLIYWSLRKLGRMQLMQGVLGAVWGISMLPIAGAVIEYFFREELMQLAYMDGVRLCSCLPGCLALGLSTFVMRHQSDTRGFNFVRQCLAWVSLITLIATYQWLDESYMPETWLRVGTEGGLTALLVGLAILLGHLSLRYRRSLIGCHILSGLCLVRIVTLHLGDDGARGESFFVNALLLQFGVPFLASSAIAWICGQAQLQNIRCIYQVVAMCLGFIWASFLVQDYFGAVSLLPNHPGNEQVYAYSVVWLLLAVVYQSFGLWRNQAALHGGSLVLLLLTIGKVFLIDTSALEGIFRVFSFLGLGIALIGIGFFYNKVVFVRQQSK